MEKVERFKVTNTTVKPSNIVDGKDRRKPSEAVGHFIQMEDDQGKMRLIGPGKFLVVGTVTEWMVEQEKAGELKIEPITNMGSVLESFRTQHKAESFKKEEKKAELQKVKAVEMGGAPDMSEGTNPDGEPNFVVKAKRS